jgi:hypothetical protein
MTTSPTDAAARPAFTSAAECAKWLSSAPTNDTLNAATLLTRQLALLQSFRLAGAERLSILETLRPAIAPVQDELARKFSGKPLPLAPAEQMAFDACRALWHALSSAYLRCYENLISGDATLKPRTALILQRALAAFCDEHLEFHRAGLGIPSEHWKLLHQTFAAAEQCGVMNSELADPLRSGKLPTTPAAAYFEAVLLQAAGLNELSLRHQGWVARWARRWAAKLQLFDAPPTLSPRAIPLVIDLESDAPASYRPLTGPGVRWLDTVELRHSLRKRIALLEQGEPPAKLNLGSDCTQPACETLLKSCYQRWCKGATQRNASHVTTSGACRFVIGFDAVHYYLAGRKPFKQPGGSTMALLRREAEEIATFGRVATHRDENFSEQHGYQLEEWRVVEDWERSDAGAGGMRIARSLTQPGERVGHGQLVAIGHSGANGFVLGHIAWARISQAGELEAGVALYPGIAQAIAARVTGVSAVKEVFRQAFLLPELTALEEPASIVIPVGTYKIDRVLEVSTDQVGQIKLGRLLDRGTDFERATFTAC